MTMLNVPRVAGVRRDYPSWNTRAKIRKVDEAGNVLPGQHAYGGEAVRVSPRFLKNGTNFRIRPERPAVFFAAWCHENGLLPNPLTPEEAESAEGLELLEPLWDSYQQYFPKLESPFAACDEATQPSLRVGFSFNIFQVLVEPIGTMKSAARPGNRMVAPTALGNGAAIESIAQRLAAMRARSNGSATAGQPTPTKSKK